MENKHIVYYTQESTDDEIQSMDFHTVDRIEALLAFYANSKGENSVSAREYELFEKALYELTFFEAVELINSIMTDRKIVEVQRVSVEQCYPF